MLLGHYTRHAGETRVENTFAMILRNPTIFIQIRESTTNFQSPRNLRALLGRISWGPRGVNDTAPVTVEH